MHQVAVISILWAALFSAVSNFHSSPPEKPSLIKFCIRNKGLDTLSYTYTPDGKFRSSSDIKGIKDQFQYSDNKIIRQHIDSNYYRSTDTVIINERGLADSSYWIFGGMKEITHYTYDANDYLIGKKVIQLSYSYSASHYWTVEDGNVVSEAQTDAGGNKIWAIYYEFYKDKVSTISSENYGLSYTGKGSKNLISKYFYVNARGDTIAAKKYSYTFDNEERVQTQYEFGDNGKLIDAISYMYY